MIGTTILLIVALLLIWILLSPIELFVDTRFPIASIRWRTIGNASIQFQEGEFWLKAKLFFIEWQWPMKNIHASKKEKRVTKKKKRKTNALRFFPRMWRMIQTFRVKEFEAAFSPDDYCLAGKLYPLNYLSIPPLRNVFINFRGENYIVTKIESVPWRMLFAMIRK